MAAYDILTTAEAKAYLGVSSSDKDTIIGTFISDVSLWIEGYTGRKIVGSQSVATEVGNGDGTERYYAKFGPITAVSSLQYRNSPTASWTDLVSNASNILIDPQNGDYVEVYGTVFPYGRSNIRMSYTAGYSTVPAPVKLVAYEMVAMRFRDSNDAALGQARLGVQSQSRTEAGGTTNSKTFVDLMPRWEQMLRGYRSSHGQTFMVR